MPITRERAALILQEKLGTEAGLEILEFFRPVEHEQLVTRQDLSETELRLVKEIKEVELQINGVEGSLQKEIREVEGRLQKEMQKIELRLQQQIADVRIELSRQTNRLILVIGGILAVLKLLDYVLPPL